MELNFTVDGFRILYGTIAAFMWLIASLVSKEYFAHAKNKTRFYIFYFLTFIAIEGVFFSANLFTLFLFFEMMSFTSYVWVAQEEKKEALKAANTYLAIAVLGGLVMLMGLFLLYSEIGTLEIVQFPTLVEAANPQKIWIASLCMLFGFGAKAGAFPLHIWLPKAHPVAPAPASALLSGILTKAGIFGILIISCYILPELHIWGELLLILGLCTMIMGALLALCSWDLKRTFACSTVSQIGFILVGISMMVLLGEENALAAQGSLLHMVNHSLFKLVLFLLAGVVYMNTHELDLRKIQGFGRNKHLLKAIYLCGALGIMGIPGFSGYISKTLIHEAIVEWKGPMAVEVLFLIGGGMTVAYMTRVFLVVFVKKNEDEALQAKFDKQEKAYMSPLTGGALTVSAVLIPIFGILPQYTMNTMAEMSMGFLKVAHVHTVAYFSFTNLKGSIFSILIGVVVFGIFRKGITWPKWMDLEEVVYRPLLLKVIPTVLLIPARICDTLLDGIIIILRSTLYRDSGIPHELDEGSIMSHRVGNLLDGMVKGLNATIWRKQKKKVNLGHRLALWEEGASEEMTLIGRSLSFGLLLFCIGLCIILIYLLFS